MSCLNNFAMAFKLEKDLAIHYIFIYWRRVPTFYLLFVASYFKIDFICLFCSCMEYCALSAFVNIESNLPSWETILSAILFDFFRTSASMWIGSPSIGSGRSNSLSGFVPDASPLSPVRGLSGRSPPGPRTFSKLDKLPQAFWTVNEKKFSKYCCLVTVVNQMK